MVCDWVCNLVVLGKLNCGVLPNLVVGALQKSYKIQVKRVANKRRVTEKGDGSWSRSAPPIFVSVDVEEIYKTYTSSRSVMKERGSNWERGHFQTLQITSMHEDGVLG